ncbi:MAG TPA: DoxX family protein [Chitinophagaceae bacterium]
MDKWLFKNVLTFCEEQYSELTIIKNSTLFFNIAKNQYQVSMKKLFSYKYSDNMIALSLLLLRLTLGGLMIPHGVQKLTRFAAKSSTFSDPFNIGSPTSMALAIFAELFCAAFIVVGLMTRLACLPLIVAMSVAVLYSHNSDVFGNGEHAALYLGGFVALLFTGPGKISMDRLISK